MKGEVPYWSPSRLYLLSLKVVVDTIKECFHEGGLEKLTKSQLAFPTSTCNHLIESLVSSYSTSKDQYLRSLLSAIVNSPWCRFTKLYVRHPRDANDYFPLTTLFQCSLTELAIEYDSASCKKNVNLTEIGRAFGNTLVSLTLKQCNIIEYENLQYGFSCLVKLMRLTLQYISFSGSCHGQNKTTLPVLPCLEVLNLTLEDVITTENILSLQRNVKVLQLYKTPVHKDMLEELTNIVVLDISRKLPVATSGSSINEFALMASLSKLPSLKSLDVSCREISDADVQLFDQPHHRMTFFGLFNVALGSHLDVNADQITGDRTESQILLGLELYNHRYSYSYELLFSLANFHSPLVDTERGLETILKVCQIYLKDGPLLVLATASIYLYLKNEEITTQMKRKTIWTLVDIMSKHKDYPELMQNCCICLYPYQTMQDSGFVLTKLATALVYVVQQSVSMRTLLMALLGLSKLIWWLPKPKKVWLAQLSTIEITLDVLKTLNNLDPLGFEENPLDLMEACWNILWNMTDECPENCMLFCASGGIDVTLICYQAHREAFEDAMPSIFGALGNVVEVDELQSKVMSQDVMIALREAVTTDRHHRMSYSIGGVIANLAYNGDEFWGDVQPSRQSMLEFMVKEMQEWNIEGEIWIEFNSLKPLMKIVQSPEDEVAYWAVKTIAGLSMIRKERYCSLLHKEQVIPVFKEIAARTNCVNLSPSLPQLAEIIVQNYESFYSGQQPMDTA